MIMLASNPIFDSFFHSDLFGKAIFTSLFVLSLLTWYIFLLKWRSLKEFRKGAPKIKEALLKRWQAPLSIDLPLKEHPYAIVYNLLKLQSEEILAKKGKNDPTLTKDELKIIEESVYISSENQVKHFEKNLFLLSTVVTLAPFMGLLGTVWGILLTFSELQKGTISNANSMVMSGLAMALGTTVVGLLVAIPALISYNYLKSHLIHFGSDMEEFARSLVSSVERHYLKREQDGKTL